DRHQIPCPRTLVVHEANVEEVAGVVGLPCVLKKPDGAFSSGVVKVSTREELQAGLEELFRQSELVVAQEYMPSSFDWRIGVLDGRALFACRYHMAKGHWQIAQRVDGDTRYGRVEAVELETVPPRVLDVGVRAASLMGEGLYGVDLKEVDGRVVVMEVNDNPNLDAGNEDGVLKDALYDELAAWFLARLDRRGRDRRGA
ncbi:MAG: RimK family alpha-L-glutamate ligase, partial [Gemmatimonadota bacterium]|nr:RimK family alpha-L-glutamate ligase [Gemmatimonadota bacterium]